MIKCKPGTTIAMLLFAATLLIPFSAAASADLVSLLTSQLGVTSAQAAGGAGAFFKTAKENMLPDDFSTLAQKVPEATSLLGKAPGITDNSNSLVTGVSSLLGDSGAKLNSANSLIQSFEKLGLKNDMVQQFAPVIMDYVKKKAGPMSMQLLQSALSL